MRADWSRAGQIADRLKGRAEKARRHECPTCKTPPGQACVRTDGTERPAWLVHPSRRAL